MSAAVGTMGSMWASTAPLPSGSPARPSTSEPNQKRGRAPRPSRGTFTPGGNARRRGRGGASAPITASSDTNPTPSVEKAKVSPTLNSTHPSPLPTSPTIISSVNIASDSPAPAQANPTTRPARSSRKRTKPTVPKVEVPLVTNVAPVSQPLPTPTVPSQRSQRKRGKASKTSAPRESAPKPFSSIISLPSSSPTADSISEPTTPHSTTSTKGDSTSVPTHVTIKSPPYTVDLSSSKQSSSASLAPALLLPDTLRPSTPASHIDWADNDTDDLPDLDDWGVSSSKLAQNPAPPQLHTDAQSPLASSSVETRSEAPHAPGDDSIPAIIAIQSIQDDAQLVLEEIVTSEISKPPEPSPATPVEPVAPVPPKVRGRPPLDPARELEKKRIRNERTKTRRALKVIARAQATVAPEGVASVNAGGGGGAADTVSKKPDVEAEVVDQEDSTSAPNGASGTELSVGDTAAAFVESTRTERRSRRSTTSSTSTPVLTAAATTLQESATAPVPQSSIPHHSLPQRPASSLRSHGEYNPSRGPSRDGHRSVRDTSSPTQSNAFGGRRRQHEHRASHSHSTSRPVISANALSQLTKSLSGGTRQHRAPATVEAE